MAEAAEREAALAAALAEAMRKAAEKDAELAEVTRKAAEKDAALAEAIRRAEDKAAEKDAELAEATRKAAEKDAALAEAIRRAEEKDAALAEKDAAMAEAERQRKKAEEAVASKDAEIARQQEDLREALRRDLLHQTELQHRLEQLRMYKINPKSLITSALPRVEDLTSTESSTARAAESVKVRVVQKMRDFKGRQKKYTLSILADLEKRADVTNFPEGNLPDGERRAGSEGDLNSILESTAFFALNRLLDGVTSSSVALGGHKINADGASYLAHELKLLLLYELKRHNLTAHGLDLVLTCKAKLRNPHDRTCSKDSLDAVQQLVGYMIIAKLRFGVLTTYEYWWVVELCENGHVRISTTYCWSDTGACSVLAMLHYVVHLARESLGKFTAPSLPRLADVYGKEPDADGGAADDKENHDSNGRQHGGGASGSKGGKGPTKHKGAGGGKSACGGGGGGGGGGVFEFVRFLQEHSDRITFQARMAGEGGRLAAIKAYDTAKARDAEAARYRRLQGLEAVPQLLRERLGLVWTDTEERRVHALVLAWVGPEDAGGERFGGARAAALTAGAVSQVRNALSAMHGRGVAHEDVREDNVVWDAAEGRAYVVDLSHAATEGDVGPAEFARICNEDLYCAERLMADTRDVCGAAALRRGVSCAAAAASAASPALLLR